MTFPSMRYLKSRCTLENARIWAIKIGLTVGCITAGVVSTFAVGAAAGWL